MPARYYGQNKYRQNAIIKTRDLRYPIALLKKEQKPSATDETWHLNVKPYASPFAAFDEGITRPGDNDEKDHETLHLFIVRRDPSLKIESGDFIVFEDVLYIVVGLQTRRGQREFTELRANIFSALATSGVVLDDTIEIESKPMEKNNPFFDDDDEG